MFEGSLLPIREKVYFVHKDNKIYRDSIENDNGIVLSGQLFAGKRIVLTNVNEDNTIASIDYLFNARKNDYGIDDVIIVTNKSVHDLYYIKSNIELGVSFIADYNNEYANMLVKNNENFFFVVDDGIIEYSQIGNVNWVEVTNYLSSTPINVIVDL